MRTFAVVVALLLAAPLSAGSGNRLTYLDGSDVYHPHRSFPRLVTPAWVGEKDVEAVVILGIDDMRGVQPWENYLRPVLERLKKIDGRAPVSIMTCQIDPAEPHLQRWLKEGVSLETHTIDHPCPLLGRGGLETARSTFDRCVDLLHRVPNNRPVAFRTPCCDSQNTPSPRFFAEIFNRVTPGGNHLAIDTSVFNVPTANDPEVPREWVMESTGRERFRKYLPSASPFGNFIEDYPYPYVINRRCWEFPCATPSDWQGQHRHGVASPLTLADMKASLDIAVRKQGVFCLVFHPYGWMSPAQVVALIDHAVARYGPKVKFLTFREAHERLVKNLLAGQPLRSADGGDNGVRLLDLDGDGFMDVVIGNDWLRQTRRWQPRTGTWAVSDFPAAIVTGSKDAGARFGVLHADGRASLLTDTVWGYSEKGWERQADGRAGLEVDGMPVNVVEAGRDRGVRLRDLDGDGVCELLVGNERHNAAFAWTGNGWRRLPFALPDGARLADAAGRDAGLRLRRSR
ncbi:MAG: polysaccharide deacetylase family protein [Gemmataceae bacterium]